MNLNKKVIENISKIKNEDEWVKAFRLKCLETFNKLDLPNFGPKINIDFDKINYYKESSEKLTNNWDNISCQVREEFDKLGIIKAEKKYLDGSKAQ